MPLNVLPNNPISDGQSLQTDKENENLSGGAAATFQRPWGYAWKSTDQAVIGLRKTCIAKPTSNGAGNFPPVLV
jgi:hypothetical protein